MMSTVLIPVLRRGRGAPRAYRAVSRRSSARAAGPVTPRPPRLGSSATTTDELEEWRAPDGRIGGTGREPHRAGPRVDVHRGGRGAGPGHGVHHPRRHAAPGASRV